MNKTEATLLPAKTQFTTKQYTACQNTIYITSQNAIYYQKMYKHMYMYVRTYIHFNTEHPAGEINKTEAAKI